MRRSRRGGHGGLEFGGSGEDSFVAVVVTKLTGALLFILLLTMVIMALLPKAIDLPASSSREGAEKGEPLAISTPSALPEAIAGRPYALALAAHGGRGPLRWSVDGKLPDGLSFDPEAALIKGTPKTGTPEPVELAVRVSDGQDRASQAIQLVVYESDKPLGLPSKWKPSLPPIPWSAWLEQGFGFLLLWLVHMVGMNALGSLQRWSLDHHAAVESGSANGASEAGVIRRRFLLYKLFVRAASIGSAVALAVWLGWPRG